VDVLAEGEVAVFGDEDINLGVSKNYSPQVPNDDERVLGRWVAEHSSDGMFEVIGTWLGDNELHQGTLATGASENYLLVTDTYIRGVVPPRGAAKVRTNIGTVNVSAGWVFVFAIPLVDIELIDGNKRDIAIAGSVEGLMVKWARACDANWKKVSSGGPWHKDNDSFAQTVLEATIAAKLQHPDERVQASAAKARMVDRSRAYSTGRRTTFEFDTP